MEYNINYGLPSKGVIKTNSTVITENQRIPKLLEMAKQGFVVYSASQKGKELAISRFSRPMRGSEVRESLDLSPQKRYGDGVEIPIKVESLDSERPDGSNLFLLVLNGTTELPKIGIYGIAARKTISGSLGKQEYNSHDMILAQHNIDRTNVLGGSAFSFNPRVNRFVISGHSAKLGGIYPQIAFDINKALLEFQKSSGINVGADIFEVHTDQPKFVDNKIARMWGYLGYNDWPLLGSLESVFIDAENGEKYYDWPAIILK